VFRFRVYALLRVVSHAEAKKRMNAMAEFTWTEPDFQKTRFDLTHFFCDTLPMTATLEEITRTALQLPVKQRLALAGFLLETEDSSSDPEVDAVWDQEIQDRIKAVDSGVVTGISYQDVMLEAEKRLAP